MSGFLITPQSPPGVYQGVSISGTDLLGNINLSLTTSDWEISPDGQTWSNTLEMRKTSNGIVDHFIYVRLKAGLSAGTKTDVISVSSVGATTLYITLTGEVQITSAISPEVRASVSLYPNPAKESIRVRVGEMGINGTKITVLDAKGISVHKIERLDSPEINIDIKALPQGVYIMLIEGHKGTLTKQFVKR